MGCRKIVRYGCANICGSARIHHWKEICREGSGGVEKADYSFTLHFCELFFIRNLTKSEKFYISWLIANHHGLLWEDGMFSYSMVKTINYNGHS